MFVKFQRNRHVCSNFLFTVYGTYDISSIIAHMTILHWHSEFSPVNHKPNISGFFPNHQVLDKYSPPDYFLPESYTCFFLLKLPRYSCREVLREKLKYAIYFCKSIDTDDYARIALSGEPDGRDTTDDDSEDDEIDSIDFDSETVES